MSEPEFHICVFPLGGNGAMALSLWSDPKGKIGVSGAWGRYHGILSILGKSD